MRQITVIAATCLALLPFTQASGKPMPPASLAEAAKVSDRVVVAEFQSWRAEGEVGFFDPPWATYRVLKVLKGPQREDALELRFSFHDNSPCLEPERFAFDPATMPAKKSRWILFLQGSGDELRTYRGNFGRLPYSPENLERVRCLLRGKPEAECQ